MSGNLYPVPLPVAGFPAAVNYGDYLYFDGANWVAGDNKISLGGYAGETSQGNNATAVGYFAGTTNQGEESVAIGHNAGNNAQEPNTIILNATGVAVNGVSGQTDSFYVAPVRDFAGATGWKPLSYNTSTNEVAYNTTGLATNPISYIEAATAITLPDTTPVLLTTTSLTLVNPSRIWAVNTSTFQNTATSDNYLISCYLTINGTVYPTTKSAIPSRISASVPSATNIAVQAVTPSLFSPGTYTVNVYAYADRSNTTVDSDHSDLVVLAGFY